MSKTEQDLKDAFAGESQANRKYLAFAKKAEEEGYIQVAKLFRAAAAAETIHAHNHLRELKGVKSTRENLLEAITGESYEFQKMYPGMIADAKAEGQSARAPDLHLCERGGKGACRPVPEGAGHPGKLGQEHDARLLCLLRLRLYRRRRSARRMPGLQGEETGVQKGGISSEDRRI